MQSAGEEGVRPPNCTGRAKLKINTWNDLFCSDSEPEIDFREELTQMNDWLVREPYLPKNLGEKKSEGESFSLASKP